MQISVHTLGERRFVINTLKIRDNLGRVPAGRKVCSENMLKFAGRNQSKPLAERPSDFDEQLRSMGYK